jgi:Rrf2 family protein
MSTSTRFTVAIHTLTLLAQAEAEPLTSEYIAGSVNTNPVVIRRILGALRAAHLVTAQTGNGGGWRLSLPADAITLRAVYRAVEDEPLFALHHRAPNPACPVGRHIQHALVPCFEEARRTLEEKLGCTTIADILAQVLAPAPWPPPVTPNR